MKVRMELLPAAKRGTLTQDQNTLGFGSIRTDHMFVADYYDNAWHDARVVPYGAFNLMPGAACLHYGQTIFEGAKAYLHADNEIYLFRFDQNIARIDRSAEIVCMPPVPADLQWEGIKHLLDVERKWCPSIEQSSLYVRPFMFATEDMLGIKPSNKYTFCIMISPSGPYYSGGFSNAVRLLVSKKYHRAVNGGTGESKTGGNYAASLRPSENAVKMGCAQVLYLDPTNEFIDEAGSMNHFHVLKDGTFIIPRFNGTILKSITSLSVLELAKLGKIKARQEDVALKDFVAGIRSGEIVEAGGFGTAAVISPVGTYVFEDGTELVVGDGKPGKFSTELYNMYSGFQTGKVKAPEGWLCKIPRY